MGSPPTWPAPACAKRARPTSRRTTRIRTKSKAEVASPVAVQPPAFEARDVLSRLVEKGEERFPRALSGFLESKALNTTAATIAERRGVSAGRVRHERADISRFMKQHAKAMGVMMTALAFLVIGSFAHWGLRPERYGAPVPEDTMLRRRAKDECAASQWKACLEDLDRANQLHPAGETQELRDLHRLAEEKLGAAQPPP
jgi:hypothetical protein